MAISLVLDAIKKVTRMGHTNGLTANKYSGQFLEGKRHGFGKIYYSDGSVYRGNWTQNKEDGFGQFIWAKGSKFEGYWVMGKRHGTGTYI